jgi:hypothetical protein
LDLGDGAEQTPKITMQRHADPGRHSPRVSLIRMDREAGLYLRIRIRITPATDSKPIHPMRELDSITDS